MHHLYTLNGIKLYSRRIRVFLTELYLVVIGTSYVTGLVNLEFNRLLSGPEADFPGHIHVPAIKETVIHIFVYGPLTSEYLVRAIGEDVVYRLSIPEKRAKH